MFAPTYDLTCDEAMPDDECGVVANAALEAIGAVEANRGNLKSVEVHLVDDCGRLARAMFEPAFADPSITRCWAVQSVWQQAQPSVVVARMASGELIAFP